MTKARRVIVLIVSGSMAVFAVQTLSQIGRELAALPLTPRQEAIFLIMGRID